MINETEKTVSIIWGVDDVYWQADDMLVTLSENEAWEVLKRAYEQHNWLSRDLISEAINDYLREKRGL